MEKSVGGVKMGARRKEKKKKKKKEGSDGTLVPGVGHEPPKKRADQWQNVKKKTQKRERATQYPIPGPPWKMMSARASLSCVVCS
jgi:hypothetical protein